MITLQYLEESPDLAGLDPGAVAAELRAALAALPVDAVLVGWRLPPALLGAVADECARSGAALYRWHPLLTSDGSLEVRPEWMAIGPGGEPVPGFQGMPEFTFLCPSRPDALRAVLDRLRDALRSGPYRGVFLDRIRFPSPAADPPRLLACFCPDCARAAAAEGVDIEAARRRALALRRDPALARALLAGGDPALAPFLAFRRRAVARAVAEAAAVARAEGAEVGLDCFSPAIAPLVGQDLAALDPSGDWTKLMVYGHTLGPAGLPFELGDLAGWLVGACGLPEREALARLGEWCGLDMPGSLAALRAEGLPPSALAAELRRGRAEGVARLLFGVELVEIPGVAELDGARLREDLRAALGAAPDGVAVSWDLRFIPPARLALLAEELGLRAGG